MDDNKPQAPPPARAVGPSVPLIPQLPPHGNSFDRLGQHTKGLVDDVKEWVDLRIQLLQTEVRDQVKGKLNELIVEHIDKVLPVVMMAMGGLLLLFAVAYFVGSLVGHVWLGFLIVGGLLAGGGYGLLKWYQREAPLNPRSPHHPGNPDKDDDSNG